MSRRRHKQTAELRAISVCRTLWLDAIVTRYQQDPVARQRLSQIALDPNAEAGFTLKEGIIRVRDRVWIAEDKETQQSIIKLLNDSAVGGHSGFHATYNHIGRLFSWKEVNEMIKCFVRACAVCQQAKTDHKSPAGLLQPLPISRKPWAVISLDFIKGLPSSGGFDLILVVVDKFSKYANFLSLKHPFTALQVATFSCIIFTNYTICQWPSSPTAIASSQAMCGRSSLSFPRLSCDSAHRITPRRMGRRSGSTSA